MTVVFTSEEVAPDFRRYREQWESALLSLTLSDYRADARDSDRRDLHRAWRREPEAGSIRSRMLRFEPAQRPCERPGRYT